MCMPIPYTHAQGHSRTQALTDTHTPARMYTHPLAHVHVAYTRARRRVYT